MEALIVEIGETPRIRSMGTFSKVVLTAAGLVHQAKNLGKSCDNLVVLLTRKDRSNDLGDLAKTEEALADAHNAGNAEQADNQLNKLDEIYSRITELDQPMLAEEHLEAVAEDKEALKNLIIAKSMNFEDGSKILVYPAHEFNRLGLDPTVIPAGNYCYTRKTPVEGEPTHDSDGIPIFKLTYCPYMSTKEFNGVTVTWCNYLDKGDMGNHLTDEEHQKLLEHFGTTEAMEKELPLFLLWDSCKECGIKDDY